MQTIHGTPSVALAETALGFAGVSAAPFVEAVYPMKTLTAFHNAHHIPGLTGKWMDTGSTALGGAVKGSFHRLAHGHHLFEDGVKVLVNPELKFGQFLHHLGMDSLTARGIPNPLLPSVLGESLVNLGLNQRFVYEFMTLNLPKILTGSAGLVVSGYDVYLAFSDAIPHTFLNAGLHFGIGALGIVFGLYPPNFLLLSAGAAELSVGAATLFRTLVDPVLPTLGVPASVFLPALGQSVALAAVLGGCLGMLTGRGWGDVPKTAAAAATAAAASTTVSFMAAGAGFLAPFLGPAAGIASFLLARKALDAAFPENRSALPPYRKVFGGAAPGAGFAFPLFTLPPRPIGRLEGDTLLLHASGA